MAKEDRLERADQHRIRVLKGQQTTPGRLSSDVYKPSTGHSFSPSGQTACSAPLQLIFKKTENQKP